MSLRLIRVGIVDDHPMVRSGLRSLLSEEKDMQVAGEATDGRTASDLVRTTELDVLVLDIAMRGQGGLDVLNRICIRARRPAILIYTGYPDEHYALNLFQQGASAYLNKACEPAEILEAVRTLASGRRYITTFVAELMAAQVHGVNEALHTKLSARELQVFLRLASGQKLPVIADALSLSVQTVSAYRTRLMEKLQLSSNSGLTYYALKHQLLE